MVASSLSGDGLTANEAARRACSWARQPLYLLDEIIRQVL